MNRMKIVIVPSVRIMNISEQMIHLQDDSYLNPIDHQFDGGTQPIFHLLRQPQHVTLRALSTKRHQVDKPMNEMVN